MDFKGAVFDLDGTLLDSMPLWNSRGSDYLRGRGIEPAPDVDKRYKALSLAQASEYLKSEYGIPDTADEIACQLNAGVEQGYRQTVQPKEGVPEFLAFLREKKVRMCVATATERYLVEMVLRRVGLLDFFDGILTCGEVGTGKDVPDIYIKGAELLGTSIEETLVFEDAPHAIRTAKGAGFRVAAVEDGSYVAERDEIRAMSDIYVSSFYKLMEELA
ncbi:MAG: HAD family hydrolase [Oscillospiraceae bacterium]